ncbi:hypothetical protein NCCP28_37490 [Niallia sp. NCCP-28]|nr:hypothetical protein NCCP28_37490 [Niallia sp. NCCP-28]
MLGAIVEIVIFNAKIFVWNYPVRITVINEKYLSCVANVAV